ncbi:MAG: winged helix-turn-helix domain-containing protein [Tepidiformaceae bacterium]
MGATLELQPNRAPACGLPPLVGLRVAVISHGLARAYDRARGLETIGYRVTASGEPHAAASFIIDLEPDAVVIDLGRDIGTPDILAFALRAITPVPFVVVGCTGSAPEMSRCFDAGADDYCRPRCPTEEIDLRLRAIFRRSSASASGHPHIRPPIVKVGDIEIDHAGQRVRKAGIIVPLSPTEFRLLATLAERPGEVVPARALIARVWGNEYANETHYLRLYVRYLRQKLEDDPSRPRYIVNRWGAGYALEEPAAAA